MMNKKKFTLKERLLFGSPFLILIASVFPLIKPTDENGINEVMQTLSGPNATYLGPSDSLLYKRLIKAVQSRKPFYVLTGSVPKTNDLIGIVRTPKGELYDVYWQGGSWLHKGRVANMARVKHLTLSPMGNSISYDGGNGLSPEEQNRLLRKP